MIFKSIKFIHAFQCIMKVKLDLIELPRIFLVFFKKYIPNLYFSIFASNAISEKRCVDVNYICDSMIRKYDSAHCLWRLLFVNLWKLVTKLAQSGNVFHA